MDINYQWDQILGQQNISDTEIVNTAGVYGIPVTGLKQIDDHLNNILYLVDITSSKDRDKIITSVPMNHYQIIKLFLIVEYPDTKRETLMFEYNNNTNLMFRLGEIREKDYEYNIGVFKCLDVNTIMSYRSIGDYFDSMPFITTDPMPVTPVKLIALTTNRNLVQ